MNLILPLQKSPELNSCEAISTRLLPSCPDYAYWQSYYQQLLSGYIGEKSLDYYLRIAELDNTVVLQGFRTTHDNETFQIDLLILSEGFILLIESKNHKGRIQLPAHSDQMIRGNEVFSHPLIQANIQKKHLQKLLTAYNFPNAPIHTAAVFTNKKCILEKSENNPDIIVSQKIPDRIDEIKTLYPHPIYTKEELHQIGYTLRKLHTPKTLTQAIPTPFIEPGVTCINCAQRAMTWKNRTWICPKCQHKDKKAHIPTLREYAHIYGPTITNRKASHFLNISQPHITKHLLKTSGFKATGEKRGRKYMIK
ncbi:nuclease-related domain-containing protein [Alkalibacillus aidingensis]|uniref:nuclease-related domain-containing protein n=1 Tax=Alkalibacillus aidingensis TaxID=2747607 RepID=UPI001660A1A7|nr:nuclease-related domain-containing protein [Alkalibacillus aidingensis]